MGNSERSQCQWAGSCGGEQAPWKGRKEEAQRLRPGLSSPLSPGLGRGVVKEELGHREALLPALGGSRAGLVRGVVGTAAWGVPPLPRGLPEGLGGHS